MDNELIVRRFKDEDLDNLYDMICMSLESDLLKKVYEPKARQAWLDMYTKKYILGCSKLKHLYVAKLKDKIVGSAAINEDDIGVYVSAVFIDPSIQKRGVGKKLMQTIEQDEVSQRCKKMYLYAALSASNFYKKMGYSFKYDVPEIMLDEGVDFVYMEKYL